MLSAVTVGAVLAGGRSSRMGQDKALLPWKGETLWERQVRVLREWGASPAAVVRAADQPGLGDPCWRDGRPGMGPLAGLEAALEHCPAGGRMAVLAVDLAWMEPAWFEWLAGRVSAGRGAVARHSGRYEPLAALYPASALGPVRARLDRGELRLQDLVGDLISAGILEAFYPPPRLLPAVGNLNTLPTCPSTMRT